MYLIKRAGSDLYFSSVGSYDRPKWVPLDEATRYAISEMASKAQTNLIRNLHLGISIVYESDEKAKMIAAKQAVSPEASDYELDSETPENREDEQINAIVDDDLGIEKQPLDPEAPMPVDDPMNAGDYPDEDEQFIDDTGNDGAADVDLTISEADAPKVEPMNFANTVKPLEVLVPDEEGKVQVPANVMRSLETVVKDATHIVDTTATQEKHQFAYALAGQAQILIDHLKKKTVDGIRDAQIALTALDNRLFYRLPRLATDFIMSGGKVQTLSDLFKQIKKESK